MIKGLLGQKLGMTQRFDERGKMLPLTILRVPDTFVVQVKDEDKDGYQAVQIGVVTADRRRVKKPEKGHLVKHGVKKELAKLCEVPVEGGGVSEGEQIDIDKVLQPGDIVNVQGKTKGRGFAGVIKRWGFSSQPKTHGQSDRERAPGSIGAQTPGRVLKGKKMPGHYGNQTRTVKNLVVYAIDRENGIILIKGSVPGAIKSWVLIKKTDKKYNNFVQLMTKDNEKNRETKAKKSD
jgi:large subunit ribosomal protein L3